MLLSSTQILSKMAACEGSYILVDLISTYSDHSNSNPASVVFSKDEVYGLPDDSILQDFKDASLVEETAQPDDSHRKYVLSPDGLERGKRAAARK